MLSGLIIAISLLINICAWVLEAVAVGRAFEGTSKTKVTLLIIGGIVVILGCVFIRTNIVLCIVGILAGLTLLILTAGDRMLKALIAILFLAMDVGAVYLIRMLFLGDNSSIPIAIASSTLSVMVSILVTTLRMGTLRIQEGKFKLNFKTLSK